MKNNLRIYFYNNDTATVTYLTISGFANLLTYNKWHNISITYSFSTKTIIVYLDTEIIYTFTTTANISHRLAYPTRLFLLGYTSNAGCKNSRLCEVVIDSDIWSPARVKNEYLKHKGILIA